MKAPASWLLPFVAVLLCIAIAAFVLPISLSQNAAAESADLTAEAAAEQTETRYAAPAEKAPVEDVHLRDNPLLYEDADPSSVVTMYLTVSSGNEADGSNHTWEEINTYSAYDYVNMGVDRYKVEGLLQIDETGSGVSEDSFGYRETEPNVTVQVRGQTSSRARQKNYKIRIKKGFGSFREQRTLNLNKHMGDGLRFANKLAYDLLDTIPQLIGGRTQFVHLYVRDLTADESTDEYRDYGLYTMVEQVNRTFLKNHLLDENGQLYKVTFYEWDEYSAVMMDQNDPEFDRDAFERYLEIKGNEDHTKLQQVTADVKNYLKPITETVEEHFDAENICYWMAFNILIGNYDSSARNLFLYSPMNSERFYMIPWDLDASFRRDVLDHTGHHEGESWERGMHLFLGVSLVNRMMREEEYRDMLTDAVNDLYTNYLKPATVDARARQLSKVTKRFLFGGDLPDKDGAPIKNVAVYDMLVSKVGSQIERNYRYYFDSLDNPWPFYVDVPELDADEKTLILSWGAAYDVNEEPVTYDYILATDYDFENVIDHKEGLPVPTATTKQLPEGTYFLRVRATNASGHSTDCFDYYSTHKNGKAYGCYCFVVQADGTAKAYEGSKV